MLARTFLLVGVALVGAACSEEVTTTSTTSSSTTGSTTTVGPTSTTTEAGSAVDSASVIEAGMLTADDLSTGGQSGAWEQVEVESDDLAECEDLSAVVDGVAAGLDDSAVSPQFRGETEGTTVSITMYARDSVLVYTSDTDATEAFSGLDEQAFRDCALDSVAAYWEQGGSGEEDDGDGAVTVDAIDVSGGPDLDAGDESASFELQMDSSVYGDQDNEERATFVAVRVGPAIVVFTFLYSGQYFEDFDTQTDAERQVVQQVVERVDAALG